MSAKTSDVQRLLSEMLVRGWMSSLERGTRANVQASADREGITFRFRWKDATFERVLSRKELTTTPGFLIRPCDLAHSLKKEALQYRGIA